MLNTNILGKKAQSCAQISDVIVPCTYRKNIVRLSWLPRLPVLLDQQGLSDQKASCLL